jgi:ribosomal protein L4
MFKRKIKFNNKEYAIAIYSIWYKSAIENNFTKFKDIK